MPIRIDGTDITGATIDGTEVQEITVDGQTVFSAGPSNLPVAYSDLIAWYPSDASFYGGSNADDVTAIIGGSGDDTAFDGTVNGATYQSSGGVTDINAGANSGAFDFNRSANDFIDLNTKLSNQVSGSYSLSVFIKTDDNSLNQQGIFGEFNNGNIFSVLSGGRLKLHDGNSDLETSTGFISSNTYHHVVYSFDGSTTDFFVDGSNIFSPSTAGFTSGTNTVIGDIGDGFGLNFSGNIDDVRLYNKALSSSEVNQIYQNTQP